MDSLSEHLLLLALLPGGGKMRSLKLRTPVTLFRSFVLFVFAAALAFGGGVPDPYNRVHSIVWVVRDLNTAVSKLTAFGLTAVHIDEVQQVEEQFRGRVISAKLRHASAHLGSFVIEFVQPGSVDDAFAEFQKRHGAGIFAVLSPVADENEVAKQVQKMKVAGVGVLEKVTFGKDAMTFFDTEAGGKYVLGLTTASGEAPSSATLTVTHVGVDIRNAQAVSAYWQSLGWGSLKIAHATPREDSRYRERPLLLSFDVAWYKRPSLTIEWIIPPDTPPNCYADFLKEHGEGVQHLGMTVPDLDAAVARIKKLGYSIWQSGAWGEVGKKNSGRYVYVDTDQVAGIAIEIIQTYN